MNGNQETGKKAVMVAGIYMIAKAVLNGIIGGGLQAWDITIAAAFFTVLLIGLKYCNYIAAAWLVFVVLKNLGHNLSDIPGNLIYLIEAVIDMLAAVMLVFSKDVKSHFCKEKT